MTNNKLGRNGTDVNGTDFWVDGSGHGNCFSNNGTVTVDSSSVVGHTNAYLYPTCPAPGTSGSGTSAGDDEQVGELIVYVGSTASAGPELMECHWSAHPHPAYKGLKPLNVKPGPDCS